MLSRKFLLLPYLLHLYLLLHQLLRWIALSI
jgi:hypothetical protein